MRNKLHRILWGRRQALPARAVGFHRTPRLSAPQPLEAALGPLAKRVRARWLLEWICFGSLLALAGATVLILAGRLLGRPEWPFAAPIFGALALGMAVALALVSWPGPWTIAQAADRLGLSERVTSALHAQWSGHPAASLLIVEAIRALREVDPAGYVLLTRRHRWGGVLLAAAVAATITLAPMPSFGNDERQAAEAQTLAETRRSIEALGAKLTKPSVPEPLTSASAAELEALEEELARATSALEAARALEQTQERLASLPTAEDYAWRRAMERLSATWAGQPDLSALARALQASDPQSIESSLAELAAGAEELTTEQLQELQLALQAGANATRDVPALASALRQTASQSASRDAQSGSAGEGPTETQTAASATARALRDLAPALTQGAARASSLRGVQQTLAALGQTRAGLGQASGGAMAGGAMASGAPTGSATDGRASAGNGTGSSGGSGSGNGAGPQGGTGSAAGAGSGAGSGSGGGADGVGAGGSGSGSGAGRGRGPSPGQPGTGNSGPTTALGSGSPSQTGATTYDSIYAPSLPGGPDGPQMQAPGDPSSAGGETVELPESPLALGAVRPYDQVYGQYEAVARESLSRQSLPQSLQGLVQRYFSAIAPEKRGE